MEPSQETTDTFLDQEQLSLVASNVKTPEDLLAFARARRTLKELEKRNKKDFPLEAFVKYLAVAIGAAVGAIILVTSEVTSYFWDTYNFAKEARETAIEQKIQVEKQLGLANKQLESVEATRKELETLQKKAEEARDDAVQDYQNALAELENITLSRDEIIVERNEAIKETTKTRSELVEIKTELEEFIEKLSSARDDLAVAQSELTEKEAELKSLDEQMQVAQISSIRMYNCSPDIVENVFDSLSQYHKNPSFGAALQRVQNPTLYLSVQVLSNGSFQYVANIRSQSEPTREFQSRTEFGDWDITGPSVVFSLTASEPGRQQILLREMVFSRSEMVGFSRGELPKVCSTEGICFYRERTC